MAYYIVTGGAGFLGKAIAVRLKAEGHRVLSLSRRAYPELAAMGIESACADLGGECAKFERVFEGADAVFHVAAMVEMWGHYQDFFRANVVGARNVVSCCKKYAVPKLIYTSSPSVIANGADLCGVDESQPYPTHYEAFYPQTKAQAERELLAESSLTFRTIALRPHLIFGPGDTNLVPTVLKKARAGRLLKIGSGKNLSDFTYIDDCVQAHLCALRALDQNPTCAGRAYFISQGDPVPLWEWIDRVLSRNHIAPVTRQVPIWLATSLASVCENVCRLLPGMPEPPLTRFLVSEMHTSHYFNIEAAKRELGYRPSVGVWEGLGMTGA